MDTTLTLPAALERTVEEAVAKAVGERWASRIWANDTSLWTNDPEVAEKIAHRLGWLHAPTYFADEVAELTAFGESIEAAGYTDALVCGMGGSSLAPEVLMRVYPESDKGLRVHVLDSTDPAAVAALDESLDASKTIRVIATKSGSTTETLAFLAHYWALEEGRVGRIPHNKAGNEFVSITDPGAALEALPHSNYFRETFLNPADVGGRYSALTYVGLVPAALLRLDLDPLLEDARIMAEATRADADDNPALVLGAAMAALAHAGRDKLTFIIEPDLAALGAWLEQLIAESTGKDGLGIVPVDGEPLGGPEAYRDDRVFVRLGPASDSEWHTDVDARLAALVEAGHPLIDIRLDDASWVAAEFFRWEFATAVAGIGLGVNPFDEPNVTESKNNTRDVLQAFTSEGRLPETEPTATRGALRAWRQGGGEADLVDLLRAHLARVSGIGYLQIGAYIAPTAERTERLRALQAKLRDHTGAATTLGYGPRFLHSTGQLHKGGPPTGVFIQLTNGHPEDLDIPGRDETFGVLIDAQAMGDFAAFGAHDLPAVRIDLGDDADAGLLELLAAFDEALA
ncbi:MAG: glucose-6-phosphate isomerase [Candidatus Limnocylindrales bacterium]